MSAETTTAIFVRHNPRCNRETFCGSEKRSRRKSPTIKNIIKSSGTRYSDVLEAESVSATGTTTIANFRKNLKSSAARRRNSAINEARKTNDHGNGSHRSVPRYKKGLRPRSTVKASFSGPGLKYPGFAKLKNRPKVLSRNTTLRYSQPPSRWRASAQGKTARTVKIATKATVRNMRPKSRL